MAESLRNREPGGRPKRLSHGEKEVNEIWEFFRRGADRDYNPKPITDPVFKSDISYLERSFSWLERWGVLPTELNKQSKEWVRQIELMANMQSQVNREYEEWLKANPPHAR